MDLSSSRRRTTSAFAISPADEEADVRRVAAGFTPLLNAFGALTPACPRLPSFSAGVFVVFRVQVHFMHCKNTREW